MGSSVSIHKNSFIDRVEQVGKEIIQGLDWLYTNTSKFYSVSLLFQSVFDGINYIKKTPAAPLAEWSKTLINFTDLVDALKIISDVRDMVAPDDKGKMLWDKAWYEIAEHFCWTGAHALQVVTFLQKTKVIEISLIGLNILNTAISGLKIGACLFSIGNHSVKIHTASKKQKDIKAKETFWKNVKKDRLVNKDSVCQARIDKYEAEKAKLNVGASTDELDKKITKWTFLKEGTAKNVQEYARAKEKKWMAKNHAESVQKGKSWVTIAFDIALIALLAFSIILTFSPLGGVAVGVALIVLPIVVCALDVTNLLLDKYWQAKAIPTVDINKFKP